MYTNFGVQTVDDGVSGRFSPLSLSNTTYCNGTSTNLLSHATDYLKQESGAPRRKTQLGADGRYQMTVHMKDDSINNVQNYSTTFHASNGNRVITEPINVSPIPCNVLPEDNASSLAQFSPSKLAGSFTSATYSGTVNSDSGSGSGTISKDELLNVMTEDLVDWFVRMYPSLTQDLDVDTFYDRIADGVLICHHAVELHQRLLAQGSLVYEGDRTILKGLRVGGIQAVLPKCRPSYQYRGLRGNAATIGFVSRDNVANFLIWCRQLGMPDSVLFESEDAVCHKNPRNVAVCLLELARLGGLVGMTVPELILLEKEIDEELAKPCVNVAPTPKTEETNAASVEEKKVVIVRDTSTDPASFDTIHRIMDTPDIRHSEPANDGSSTGAVHRSNRATDLRRKKSLNTPMERCCRENKKEVKTKPEVKRPEVDMRSLDEIVRELLSQCTCKQTFPVNRIGEGRYLFGDKCTQIFVRILRNHVMVRVGGGWDTLSHFLSKYDECRKTNSSIQRVASQNDSKLSTRTNSVDSSNSNEMLDSIVSTQKSHPTGRRESPIKEQSQINTMKKSPLREPKPSNEHTISNDSKRHAIYSPNPRRKDSNEYSNDCEVHRQRNKQTQMTNGTPQNPEKRTPRKCSVDSMNKKQTTSSEGATQTLQKISAISEPSSPVKSELNASKNIPKFENHSPRSKSIPETKNNFQRSKSSTNLVPCLTPSPRSPQPEGSRIDGPSYLNNTLSKSVTNLTQDVALHSNSKPYEMMISRRPSVRRKSMVPLPSPRKKTQITKNTTLYVPCKEPWWSTSDEWQSDKSFAKSVKIVYDHQDTEKHATGCTTRSISHIPKPVQCEAYSRASCNPCIDQKISDL